ncbi:zinc ribbon domain-containing protein, partial [Staphylococcus epidermidis]
HQPYPPGRYHDGYQFKKPNKPLIVISILVAMITITLIALFFFLKHQLSPEQTVDQISDALKKEDARHLSKLLTSDGKKL